MWFLSKIVVNFPFLDYVDFQAQLGMKSSDLFQIENILRCHNFDNKTKYVSNQILSINQFLIKVLFLNLELA